MKALLNYQEWLSVCINDTKKGEKLVCGKCEGAKVIEEECDCCGHESEHDCPECDGAGFILWDSKCKPEIVFTKPLYRKQLEADINELANWCGRSYVEQLFILGLSPWQNYHPKANWQSSIINFEEPKGVH